jgi:hypothetical protein
MLPVGIEPAISTGERLQTHALDCAVTVIGTSVLLNAINLHIMFVGVCNVAFLTLLFRVVT